MLLRIFSEFETLNAVSGTCTCVSLHQTFTLIVFPKPFYIVSLSGKLIQGSCSQELQALSYMTGVIGIMVGDQCWSDYGEGGPKKINFTCIFCCLVTQDLAYCSNQTSNLWDSNDWASQKLFK